MKSIFYAVLLVTCIVIPAPNHAQPDKPNKSAANNTEVLSTLEPSHPRIMVTNSDVERIKQLLITHPDGRKWFDSFHKRAELILSEPPVKHELIGPRLLQQSRLAFNRITLLSLLHRIQADKRYLNRAVLEMETAAAFPDWNPSHFLDTAEMTTALAIGYDWLYDDLSEKTRETVREAIAKKGLQEGMKIYRKGARWIKGSNNWNHVCNGGMIIGALAIADEKPALAARVLNRSLDSLQHGMALFGPDGGWLEASGYWIYTMQFTAYALSALETALGTTHGLAEVPGFERTGYFMLAMEGPTGKHFNWGDCTETFRNIPELYFLARRFNQPVIGWLAEKHAGGELNLFDLVWHTQETENPKEKTQFDWFFDGIKVGSMRSGWDNTNASFVAYKGGDNMAPHSNNDLGTFVFDAEGHRWAVELGGDDYNLPGYWNRTQRLNYYRIRTEGQNTLVINGKEQNIHGKADILARSSDQPSASAIADLTNGYQGTADRVLRGFMLTGNDINVSARRHLVIQDEIHSSGTLDINWYMHTQANVKIVGQEAILTQGNKAVKLTVIEPAGATLTAAGADQNPPQRSNKGISRIAVNHKQQAGSTRIIVQLSPLSLPAFNYQPKPLAQWK